MLLLCVLLGMQATRAEIRDTIVVARDGTGQYRNIAEALEACRAFMDYEMLICVKAGTYKEKLIVPAWLEIIIIEGEDVERTVSPMTTMPISTIWAPSAPTRCASMVMESRSATSPSRTMRLRWGRP